MDSDAFILIGGRSSRFGTDKAFVEFEGQSLAAHIADRVKAALDHSRISFVAANSEQFESDLLNKLDGHVIFDIKPGFGAWSGLHAALTYAQNEWIFVSACDHPMISPEFLKLMASRITDAHDAVVPRQPDERLQPLCAFYRVNAALAAVEEIFVAGGRLSPLTAIFDRLKTRVVGSDEYCHLKNADNFFLNINTADDLGIHHKGHKV